MIFLVSSSKAQSINDICSATISKNIDTYVGKRDSNKKTNEQIK